MQLIAILLCAMNLTMPIIAIATAAPRLDKNDPRETSIFAALICALASTVLYLNAGIINYPMGHIEVWDIAITFFISLVIGSIIGYVIPKEFINRFDNISKNDPADQAMGPKKED